MKLHPESSDRPLIHAKNMLYENSAFSVSGEGLGASVQPKIMGVSNNSSTQGLKQQPSYASLVRQSKAPATLSPQMVVTTPILKNTSADLNATATTIQAALRGFMARKQELEMLRRENAEIRYIMEEQQNQYQTLLEAKDFVIQDLRLKLRSLQGGQGPPNLQVDPPMKSSRSTIFQHQMEGGAGGPPGHLFTPHHYPHQSTMKTSTDDAYNPPVSTYHHRKTSAEPPFNHHHLLQQQQQQHQQPHQSHERTTSFHSNQSLQRSTTPTWGSQSELHLKTTDSELTNTDLMRNIWTPPAVVSPGGGGSSSHVSPSFIRPPPKSQSMASLVSSSHFDDVGSTNQLPLSLALLDIGDDDKEMKASFKSIVEKIVKTNDQPCSIYLQQRLKNEISSYVKELIFEAILCQVIPLMKNRFGNFLVQCLLDYGTLEQFNSISLKMLGQVVQLSCDRFACHVMQKAIEKVREDIKLQLVRELYKEKEGIPETITHRFCVHVWQRVFEAKWTETPGEDQESIHREILHAVKEACLGQWATIANCENGSLVVQCIFEHCAQKEKASIIEEIFQCTYEIAKGQWGNWVIQHILEKGETAHQAHIVQVVLGDDFMMSKDQYASKVVEKCVKIASRKDLRKFVDLLVTVQPNETEPFLLSMINDQYANYVVQNLLGIVETSQREALVKIISPYLPLLRSSKYGQRVASLCEKHLRISYN